MVASIRLMAVTSGGNGINVEKTPFTNKPIRPYSAEENIYEAVQCINNLSEQLLPLFFDQKDAKEHHLHHCQTEDSADYL